MADLVRYKYVDRNEVYNISVVSQRDGTMSCNCPVHNGQKKYNSGRQSKLDRKTISVL